MENNSQLNARMRSSRMRTFHLLTVSHSAWGVSAQPPDADPLVADPPGHVTCDACLEDNSPCEDNDTQV